MKRHTRVLSRGSVGEGRAGGGAGGVKRGTELRPLLLAALKSELLLLLAAALRDSLLLLEPLRVALLLLLATLSAMKRVVSLNIRSSLGLSLARSARALSWWSS